MQSLYPKIQKSAELPIGHPEVLLPDDMPNNGRNIGVEFLRNNFGIYQAYISAPAECHIPVLGVRGKKLKFGLCYKCVCDSDKSDWLPSYCTHVDKDRAFLGTYCSNELLLALENNYKVSKKKTTTLARAKVRWVFRKLNLLEKQNETPCMMSELHTILRSR